MKVSRRRTTKMNRNIMHAHIMIVTKKERKKERETSCEGLWRGKAEAGVACRAGAS